jgi:ATP-dependent Lon protease
VGGIKEKVLAAHRAGIKTVILPKRNEPDLAEIPEDIRKEMNFVLVDHVDEVFRIAFADKQERKEADEGQASDSGPAPGHSEPNTA